MSAAPAEKIQMVDPKTLLFSLATINDALPVVSQTLRPSRSDLKLHEDDWRQFEAVSKSNQAAVEQELADIQTIYREKSKPAGEFRVFTAIHVRKRITQPIPASVRWSELLTAFGIESGTVHGIVLEQNAVVRGGFSFHIAQLSVFGTRNGEAVESICFEMTRSPGLDVARAGKIAKFFEQNGLILVHWPSATPISEAEAILGYLRQTAAAKK
jgi:hypothetical protein